MLSPTEANPELSGSSGTLALRGCLPGCSGVWGSPGAGQGNSPFLDALTPTRMPPLPRVSRLAVTRDKARYLKMGSREVTVLS